MKRTEFSTFVKNLGLSDSLPKDVFDETMKISGFEARFKSLQQNLSLNNIESFYILLAFHIQFNDLLDEFIKFKGSSEKLGRLRFLFESITEQVAIKSIVYDYLRGIDITQSNLYFHISEIKPIHSFPIWNQGTIESFLNLTTLRESSLELLKDEFEFRNIFEIARILHEKNLRFFRVIAKVENINEYENLRCFTLITGNVLLLDEDKIIIDKEIIQTGGILILSKEYTKYIMPLVIESKVSGLELWEGFNQQFNLDLSNDEVSKLASIYPLSFKNIYHICLEASCGFGKVTKNEVLKLAKKYNNIDIEKYTRKVRPNYMFEDCVLPEKTKLRLHEIVMFISSQMKRKKLSHFASHERGLATVCVFKGSSGTGKTMAAEALANELGVDLYRVDLASVTSKYVGETQKNLGRIFKSAKGCGGIIFFDEGESLFSKRMNAKSSNDKYANLEVNYLLQELENFDGTVIISTNNADQIDPAFLRRITFDLTFPKPNEKAKLQIWKDHLKNNFGISADVDLKFLSEMTVTGGIIKNICNLALSKSILREEEVKMKDILYGIRLEFQKLQIELYEDDFNNKQWWKHVSPSWEKINSMKVLKEIEGVQ
ncbi:MAG: ATP-binding protein [Halobacteriovoraceae bacterium]|nr:ATP-binding protein [Halobacteriovoraceae bacterium]